MHKLLVPIFLVLTFVAFGQPGVATIVEIEGKKYYQHKVEDGNTLWGMQGMYGVPYQEIIEANPNFDGLKEGQVVLVPMKDEPKKDVVTSDYKVRNRETLYGLSKKFNTTVDKLIELNPVLAQEGLKKGQVIKVPGEVKDPVEEEQGQEVTQEVTSYNPFVTDTVVTENETSNVVVSFSDSTVNHKVLAHETMYSISRRYMVKVSEIMKLNHLTSTSLREGQELIIPVKLERVEEVPVKAVEDYDPDSDEPIFFDSKEEYNIALLLPLYLEYGKGYSEYISGLATQFYMGATLALDSLEKLGLNAKVHIYDTRNDSLTVSGILNNPEFNNTDLVIGPLLSGGMQLVADHCKQNKIRMVCPVSANADLLKENRLVYASVPSNITLMQGLAKFMLDHNKKDNIILIKPLDKKSLPLYEAFRKTFLETPVEGSRPGLTESTVEGFNLHMKKGTNNCFVVPSLDRRTATKFMNNVNRSSFRSKKDGIYVYGTKEWGKFSELNNVFKNKYNLHFAAPTYMDYYTDEMIELNKQFRAQFGTDMSKVAVQAYDLLTHFCSEFFIEKEMNLQMMNAISMKQVSSVDGYENTRVFIVEQEDFELVKVGMSEGF